MRALSMTALGMALLCAAPAAQTVYPKGTTIYDPAKTWNGYTLFPEPGGKVILIDMNGNVVNEWLPQAGTVLRSPEALTNGRILALMNPSSGPDKTIVEFDYAGNILWSYTVPPWLTEIHHDFERLPNGNTLLMCSMENITVPYISPLPIIDDCLVEVTQSGQIAWSWFTFQHFYGLGLNVVERQLISAAGGDWAHANSSQTIPANLHTDPALAQGNIIVSQRHTNCVFIIEKTTKNIVWKIGPSDNMTQGQHNPYMIPLGLPGAGNILVFDNGAGTGYPAVMDDNDGTSRIKEIDPLTKTVVWEYSAQSPGTGGFGRDFYSDIVSNAIRLPNGNTFICSGVQGRLFEVTTTGEIVWEYMSPYTGTDPAVKRRLIYRAYRVPFSFVP